MAASISKLTTKPEKLRQDQAEKLREALLVIEEQIELPLGVMRDMFSVLDRRTASQGKWTFVMLSPAQNAIVVRYLRQHSKRPLIALELWAMCFEHLRTDTGEITLYRDQIAEKLGQTPNDISRIMGELETCGAIIKQREKVGGMRGPGIVRYFMNPRVATHLAGSERDNAQAEAPPLLSIMQGGKV